MAVESSMGECGRDRGDEIFRVMKSMKDKGGLLFLETSRAR